MNNIIRQRAIETLTRRWETQCFAYPVTSKITLQRYLMRNVPYSIKNIKRFKALMPPSHKAVIHP